MNTDACWHWLFVYYPWLFWVSGKLLGVHVIACLEFSNFVKLKRRPKNIEPLLSERPFGIDLM